ncbi:MAG: divergent polysaccharide deacetylase family protein [Bdellovibrionales bacterium]
MARKPKKTSRWVWGLWAFVLFAGLSLFFIPVPSSTPKMHWRVPVQMPKVELPHVDVSKEVSAFSHKIQGFPDIRVPQVPLDQVRKLGDKVSQAIPELPPFPYEEPSKEPVAPSPEPSVHPAPAVPKPKPYASQEGAHKPVESALPTAKVALIIDDMGVVERLSRRAALLPAPVTLSYLPYASNLVAQAEAAQAKGHDIMLHLPMEPLGHENPGPGALMDNQDSQTWQILTLKALHSYDGFIGANNHMGSRLTMNAQAMRTVGAVLRDNGLFFVDSRTSGKSLAARVMQESGVSQVGRDVFLDDTQTRAAVDKELARLEQVARRKGAAVAIGHPHAVTLDALAHWMPLAQERGITFVPVRTLVSP